MGMAQESGIPKWNSGKWKHRPPAVCPSPEDMKRSTVRANIVTYCAAMSACENRLAWEPAIALLEDARDSGIEP